MRFANTLPGPSVRWLVVSPGSLAVIPDAGELAGMDRGRLLDAWDAYLDSKDAAHEGPDGKLATA